ncbi:MAG: hypothetical protein ABJF01_22145 [bacterium]
MTPSRRMLVARALLGALTLSSACARDVAAPNVPAVVPVVAPPGASFRRGGRDPDFLEPAAGAPTIANPVIQFWAVKGRDARVKMVYHSRADRRGRDGGGGDSVVFAEFRIRDKSLARRPDGSPIANGDSVLIAMTLVDASRGIIDFQPSGLRFSAKDPASLVISFENANLDLNGDGTVDFRDRLLESTLYIAVRESLGAPWMPLPSKVNSNGQQVTTSVLGFSGYAIDY